MRLVILLGVATLLAACSTVRVGSASPSLVVMHGSRAKMEEMQSAADVECRRFNLSRVAKLSGVTNEKVFSFNCVD